MPGKGIRKVIHVESIKYVSRNETRVEGERHGGGDGPTELSIHRRVMRQRGSLSDLSIIKHVSEFMLHLVANSPSIQAPKMVRHGEAAGEKGNAVANLKEGGRVNRESKEIKEVQEAWAALNPGREVSYFSQRAP